MDDKLMITKGNYKGIERFAEMVKDGVEKRLGDKYQVTVCKTDKNNGVGYTGLCIKRDDTDIAPIIYLDGYYAAYEKHQTSPDGTADYVVGVYKGNRSKQIVDMRYFLDYGNVAGSIVYKLVNTGMNGELLEDVPHMEFLDLSIVFEVLISSAASGVASVLVHNAHLKLWDVSVEELYRAAKVNTPLLLSYEIKGMKETLCEIMQEDAAEDFNYEECMAELAASVPMYVLTNKRRVGGAACILYPKLIRNFADTIESSFYIIPSSIHETLLLPAENTEDGAELRDMIKDVNDTQVKPEEILSYSLYFYDREKDEIRMV